MELLESRIKRSSGEQVEGRTASRVVAHKFGGSSLADAARFRDVASILLRRDDFVQVTVVSAMKGVTDALIQLAGAARSGESEWLPLWQTLRDQHVGCAAELLGSASPSIAWLDQKFAELAELLRALSLFKAIPEEAIDIIQGSGEIYAAHLLSEFLRSSNEDCSMLDARDVLVVDKQSGGVEVDWEASSVNLMEFRRNARSRRIVVTGFIARDQQGRPTTLGRNGSDYSGAIFAALFNAEELHIWTDVDGVMSADPRLVPEATKLEALSYHEASELAYFGAKVVHPQTMIPVMTRGLPIYIRNTFRPDGMGTKIAAAGCQGRPVKGLTLSSDLAVVNVEGNGMIGVPGTAERLFSALALAGVSVVMISQGSSEHSICCVLPDRDAATAQRVLEREFDRELAGGLLQSISVSRAISVLAAVGDGMAGKRGVAAQLFSSLARAGVNIKAIAQGSSERNISVAIAAEDAPKALRAAHAGFWLSAQTVSIGVIGRGRVGSALLEQIMQAIPRLRRDSNLDLRLRAVSNSTHMILGEQLRTREELDAAGEATDLDRMLSHLLEPHLPHTVIIDCSASDEVAERYADWLARGVHVITPNKHAGAGPGARYRAVAEAAAKGGSRFRYEATVGAGLPVIGTLRDLLDTGDELIAIDGILSGTMAWLFNQYDGAIPFSALVREARERGFTEPDPREDLCGADVARKLVILAREAGRELELSGVSVENLVPPGLSAMTREAFLDQLETLDAPIAARWEAAKRRGRVLRYVARLHEGGASVGLAEFSIDHAFARSRSTDNVVQFTTRRYSESPLVVQGPGAGPEVTAGGVFADLLRVASSLGARL
jgi:bifunctional aspartokinase / homoserine dehydrogenase 1